tara:strand:+ start:2914 stop:9021 length:6108 start_codon:yes stop_codon:yes gene_type:complete
MAEETQLDFRINVGGLNHLGRLNSEVLQLRKGILQTKPASQGLTAAFQKQKGAAGQITKIFYGQAQSLKQLVRNQKIFRREINSQVNALRAARKAVKGNAQSFAILTQQLRKAKRQMRSLPLRKLGTDLTHLSKKAVNAGKNMQWVGRQMMVGITAPMGMLLRMGMRSMESFEKQAMRTRKILALTEDEMKDLRDTMRDTARVMGVARSVVAGLTSDFAQMGKKLLGGKEQLTVMAGKYAELTLQLELVGQVSANVGRDFIGNLAGIIKETGNMHTRIEQVAGLLAKFNMLENTTALSLKDLAEAFPQVSPAAKAAGVDLVFLAGVIANMKEVGLNATESAHALKFGLQRMINPTAKVARLSEKYAAVWKDFNQDLGMGNEMLFNLAENMKLIENNAGSQAALVWLGELVGKRQASRLYAATMNMNSVAMSIREIGIELKKVTEMPAIDFEMKAPGPSGMGTHGDNSAFLKASEIVDAGSFEDVRRIIGEIFADTTSVEKFKDSVIATDMAAGELSEGLHEGSRMAAVMAVALKGMDPVLRSLVIDYMGATEAGKVFAEELKMVLEGPAARMGKLKNDMKEMLLEFGSAFYEVINPIIDSIRGFIENITKMDPAMKQAIVMMMALVGVVGPLTFTFAMFTLAIGVMGGYVVQLLPKMKALSSGLLLSKAMAGDATPAMMSFGGGLVQVGTVAKSAQKSLLNFGGTAVTMTEALRAESTIGMSQYGAYLGTIAASTNALGAGLVASTAGFSASAQIISSGGIAATTAGVTQAQGLMLSQAATAIQASALQVGGTTAQAASGLTALVIEYDTTLAALATATASGTSATAAQALTAFTTAAGLMEAEVAAVAASMGTTIAAGTAATAAASTVNEAATVKTITGIRAMYAAQRSGFATMHAGVMAKMKNMIKMMVLGRKHQSVQGGTPGKGFVMKMKSTPAGGPRLSSKQVFAQWQLNATQAVQFMDRRFKGLWMKQAEDGSWSARRVTKSFVKASSVASKIWKGQMTRATVRIDVQNKITAMKTRGYWGAAAKSSAKSIIKNIGGAFKLMAFQSFVTASFMKAVFTKSAKAIKLAMIGTGVGALLLIVGAAIVFVIAKFDKFKAAGQGALEPLKKAWNNLKKIFMEVGTVIFAEFEKLFGSKEQTEGMVKGFTGVQKVMEGVGRAAEFMSRVFITVMRKVMIPVIKGLLTVVKFVVDGISTNLQRMKNNWEQISKVINTVIRVILGVVRVYVTMQLVAFRIVAKALSILGQVFVALLNSVIVPVFQGIETVVTTVVDVIFKAIEWIVTQLLRFIGLVSPILDKLVGFVNGVINVFDKLFGTSFDDIVIDIDDMSARLQEAVATGGDLFDLGRNKIHDFVEDKLPKIVTKTGKIFNEITNGIDGASAAALSGVGGVIDAIEGKLTKIVDGEETANVIADSFKLGIDKAKDDDPKIDPQDALPMGIQEAIAIATLEGFQQGINSFVGKVKSALQAEIEAAVNAQMAWFDARTEVFLSAYDTKIDAIEATIKAEKELTATLKYESDRRAQINKMALDKENFIRSRSLAIYEGRIEDARNISVKFNLNSSKSTEKLGKIDTGREKTLLSASRKDAVDEITIAKANKAELIKIQRNALAETLDILKQELPKTDAEYADLMRRIKIEVDKGMVEAFGADAAAAGTIQEFRNIVDTALTDQFSGVFADIGVEELGITSITATVKDEVEKWGVLVDNQDFVGKFQSIFDEVNKTWTKELEWEKWAHEEFSDDFDANIARLMAHIKYLKGELDDLIKDYDSTPDYMPQGQTTYHSQYAYEVPTATGVYEGMTGGPIGSLSNLGGGINSAVMPESMPANLAVNVAAPTMDRTPPSPMTPGFSSGPITMADLGWPTDTTVGSGSSGGVFSGFLDMWEASVGKAALGAVSDFKPITWAVEAISDAITNGGDSSGGFTGDPGQRGGYKYGGFVPGKLNSIQRIKAHAGEYVMNSKAVQTTGLARLNDINAGRGEYEGGGASGITIEVENFIGAPEWFEEQMKEYDVHVKPANARAAGKESRRISSMSGMGR